MRASAALALERDGSWQRYFWPGCLLAALVALYVPTFAALWKGLWTHDSHYTQGPVVLVAACLLMGLRFSQSYDSTERASGNAPVIGWSLLLVGLTIYVAGRSQDFAALDAASLIPVLLGCVLIFFGWRFAGRLWFVFFFLLFLIPIPGSILDAVTQPLKLAVSYVVESVLYAAGYPVARNGVTLSIGQYMLMVADACSGLNSFLVLEAFGLLYMNVVRHPSVLRNAMLAVLIVPLSFIANAVRVIILVLITYHFGDSAGSGFLHSASGLLLFAVALATLCGGDALARTAFRWRGSLKRKS